MTVWDDAPLHRVRDHLAGLAAGAAPGEVLTLDAPDPDRGAGLFAGEALPDGTGGRRRGHRTWLDLGETLGLRYLTPHIAAPGRVLLRFQVLDETADWHAETSEDPTEKYGPHTTYARIDKLEEPHFLADFSAALRRVDPPAGARVLDLGINSGDEFAAFAPALGATRAQTLHYTGIDHSAGALAVARQRFPQPNYHFICHDLNRFEELDPAPQDLVVSIGTLHSPGLDGKNLVIHIRKHLLSARGAFILGFPNLRYVDGDIRMGAKMRNYRESELSLLVKDLFFYRRYLQQRGFHVMLTGKYTLLLTAVRPPEKG